MSVGIEEPLRRAAADVQLDVSDRTVEGCARHYALLLRWNRVHNLTRITTPEDAARKHYLDCLVGLAALQPAPVVLDAGAGAGFPGVLAALVWPDSRVVLVEPSHKRASFLERVREDLGLQNVEVRAARIEQANEAPLVLSRATFPWTELGVLRGVVAPGGRFAAWAGKEPDEDAWQAEVAAWGWRGRKLVLRVPGTEHRALLLGERPALAT